ncbi:helix-turn-helix domain-containing protein [Streptomyces mirabilis]|uniref:helix-turn-helix domain-containing protein n=1 Tax=Streptomyces mirabilis TaxID=68239 RepID=UPI0034003954
MSEHTRRANTIGPVGDQLRTNLVRIRQSRSLSTTALALKMAALGRPMHATGVTKIEKGDRRVDVDDLAVLAKALHVSVTQLLEPPANCDTCRGTPPLGFICSACGAGSARPDEEPTP